MVCKVHWLGARSYIPQGSSTTMKDRTPQAVTPVSSEAAQGATASKGANRRQFLGRVGMAAAAVGVAGSIPKALAKTVVNSGSGTVAAAGSFQNRVQRA